MRYTSLRTLPTFHNPTAEAIFSFPFNRREPRRGNRPQSYVRHTPCGPLVAFRCEFPETAAGVFTPVHITLPKEGVKGMSHLHSNPRLRATLRNRMLALLLAAICIPACGGGGGSSPPPGPITYLSDTWSAGPSPNWGIISPAVVVDGSIGNPIASMYLNSAAGQPQANVVTATAGGGTTLFPTSSASGGLSVSIDVLLDPGAVISFGFPSALPLTDVIIGPTSAIFEIEGTSLTLNYAGDGLWHRFSFVVAGGSAAWLRDGTIYYSHVYPKASLYVDLRAGAGNGGAHFDNALITSP